MPDHVSERSGIPPSVPKAAPGFEDLHEAAVKYLSRYAASREMLRRVLSRRVDKWVREAGQDRSLDGDRIASQAAVGRAAVLEVLDRLTELSLLDDQRFAENLGRSLLRRGQSRRNAAANLISKGIDPALAGAALPAGEEAELTAALAYARRRGLGPFRTRQETTPDLRARELARMARAGFPPGIARRVLIIDQAEAESLLRQHLRSP